MKSLPEDQEHGIVAILDALGAASYGDAEVRQFMRSREVVMELLDAKSEDVAELLSVERVTTFTFNDTVLIVLKSSKHTITSNEVRAFFSVVRKFVADSLVHGILFRGAVAIGRFKVDDKTNTIMGQAVTDAAAWYDKTDWVGVVATPRTTMKIQKMLEEKKERDWSRYLLDYDVPLKTNSNLRLKVVNWPKVFFVPLINCAKGREKEKLLELLTLHNVPLGTENKFFNTLKFFDHSHQVHAAAQTKGEKTKKIGK